jgi:ubiquinone/menaquinone biosynthesis C-methylase UbiE
MKSSVILFKRVEKIMSFNLIKPSIADQKKLVSAISKLSIDEIEQLYDLLVKMKLLKAPFPLLNSSKRKTERNRYYIQSINKILTPFLRQMPAQGKICDIGCGSGLITMGVLKKLSRKNYKIYGCDALNYLLPEPEKHIIFKKKDVLSYLKGIPDNYFDGIMEVVMLHHLPSKQQYKTCLREMIRVTKPDGFIIIVETVYKSWYEQLKNAVLDKLLNDRMSTYFHLNQPIAVSLQFLSDSELMVEIEKRNVAVIKKAVIRPTTSDPKFHILYLCRKI